jgi:hypothetical protein
MTSDGIVKTLNESNFSSTAMEKGLANRKVIVLIEDLSERFRTVVPVLRFGKKERRS